MLRVRVPSVTPSLPAATGFCDFSHKMAASATLCVIFPADILCVSDRGYLSGSRPNLRTSDETCGGWHSNSSTVSEAEGAGLRDFHWKLLTQMRHARSPHQTVGCEVLDAWLAAFELGIRHRFLYLLFNFFADPQEICPGSIVGHRNSRRQNLRHLSVA